MIVNSGILYLNDQN